MAFLPEHASNYGVVQRHAGKKMKVEEVDVERIHSKESRDSRMTEEAARMQEKQFTLNKMGDSDAPHRGKKMYGMGVQQADMEIFRKFGTFPPPPAPVMKMNNFSDDFLTSLLHPAHEKWKKEEVDKIATTESAFQKNVAKGNVDRFYRVPQHEFAVNYDPKKDSKGLIGGLIDKSFDGRHGGKRIEPYCNTPDPNPIKGFPGLGVGQEMKFDRIKPRPIEKPRNLSPIRGDSPWRAAPEPFGNPIPDRSSPVCDKNFDPLHLKEKFGSPGDPRNHAQRMKHIERRPSNAAKLLKGQIETVPEDKVRTVKMFPDITVNTTEGCVPGFRGVGRPDREIDRARGRCHVQPVHWEPRRAYSSLN